MSFPRRTVLGTCDLTLLPRIRVFAGDRPPSGTSEKKWPPIMSPYRKQRPRSLYDPLTCNDGGITHWSLPDMSGATGPERDADLPEVWRAGSTGRKINGYGWPAARRAGRGCSGRWSSGDAAGGGDLGHGEGLGVVHALGFAGQFGCHLGAGGRRCGRGPGRRGPAIVRSWMRAASYSAISAKMPKTSLPWAVVVSTMPLVSDLTPTPQASRLVTISMRSAKSWTPPWVPIFARQRRPWSICQEIPPTHGLPAFPMLQTPWRPPPGRRLAAAARLSAARSWKRSGRCSASCQRAPKCRRGAWCSWTGY